MNYVLCFLSSPHHLSFSPNTQLQSHRVGRFSWLIMVQMESRAFRLWPWPMQQQPPSLEPPSSSTHRLVTASRYWFPVTRWWSKVGVCCLISSVEMKWCIIVLKLLLSNILDSLSLSVSVLTSTLCQPPFSCLRWRPGVSDQSSPCQHHRSGGGHGVIPCPPHPGCYWGGHPQKGSPPDEKQVWTGVLCVVFLSDLNSGSAVHCEFSNIQASALVKVHDQNMY